MESIIKKDWKSICDEINVKSKVDILKFRIIDKKSVNSIMN